MAEAQFPVWAGVTQAHTTGKNALQPPSWNQWICQDWFLAAVSLLSLNVKKWWKYLSMYNI